MKKGSHHNEEAIRKNRLAHLGKPSGNKGKRGWHPTKKTRQKQREAKLGKKNPMYGKDLSGEKNPFYNHLHSEKTKQLMKDNHLDVSGEKNPMWGLGGLQGENNPSWRGGNRGDYVDGWLNIAETIRQRDNTICVLCGKLSQFRKHCVHHIDCHKDNNDPLNLVTLCISCHMRLHGTTDTEQAYEVALSNWIRQRFGIQKEQSSITTGGVMWLQ
jgi:hypothetical protein